MSRVFTTPGGRFDNAETISDGVLIDASGFRFVNAEAGRVYGRLAFGQGGSVVENQIGGLIGLGREQPASDRAISITGSAGADTVVNAGTIKGTVALGDGDDGFVEHGMTTFVDLGGGDDSYLVDTATRFGTVEGGAGHDGLTVAGSTDVYGGAFAGFEDLTISGTGSAIGFSDYASITFRGAASFRLYDSDDARVTASLAGQSLTLGNSTLAAIVGSGGTEAVELVNGAHILRDIALGDGTDRVTIADTARASAIDGTIDGGEGRDTLQFFWFEPGDRSYDLSHVRGFEILSVNGDRVLPGVSQVGIAHADGFAQIMALSGTVLDLTASDSPNANAAVIGASLSLDEDTVLRRVGYSDEFGFAQPIDLALGDDSLDTVVVNHGSIVGEIRFQAGDDVYDGTTGHVGGPVYGNAGNDVLLGGAGGETMAGGYGADTIEGNDGDDTLSGNAGGDVLRGGAGADHLSGGSGDDLFLGTAAEVSGDTIGDLARGDRIAIADTSTDSFAYTRIGDRLTLADGSAVTLAGAPNVRLALSNTLDGATLTAIVRDGHLGDFTGDGHSDILWATENGAVSSWTVAGNADGDQVHENAFFATVDPSWHVVETLDFDGDGRSDILWRNDDGGISVWTAATGGFVGGAYNHGAVGGRWAIAATGDYDGDGKDDLLWRDADGAISIWSATGSAFSENSYYHGPVGAGWRVAGSTDLDGDGRDDIVWRNADGAISTWLARGTGFAESSFYQAGVPTAWHIAGLGDLDGDGRGDLIWRNDNGDMSVWRSNGAGFDQTAYYQSVPTGWHIEQIADFNDDGRADILWRNDDGRLSSWQSNNGGFDQDVLHGDGPAAGWAIQSHDFLYG